MTPGHISSPAPSWFKRTWTALTAAWPRYRMCVVFLLTVCAYGFLYLAYYAGRPIQEFFAVVPAVVLALLALLLAERQSHQVGRVSDLAERQSKQLELLDGFVRNIAGLGEYVSKAASMYSDEKAERVVTSLRHWLCTDQYATMIETGLTAAKAEEIVFLGYIEWNWHFPGVLWRFNLLRRLAHKASNQQRFRITHLIRPAPLFVVSRRKSTAGGAKQGGSLLIGNPDPASSTKAYGVDLGQRSPEQVEHYNFIYDALFCVGACGAQNCPAKVVAPEYGPCDGLRRVFEVGAFQFPDGTVFQHRSSEEAALRSECAQQVAHLFSIQIQLPDRADERELAADEKRMHKHVEEFLENLEATGILKKVADGTGKTWHYTLGDGYSAQQLPECKNLFGR